MTSSGLVLLFLSDNFQLYGVLFWLCLFLLCCHIKTSCDSLFCEKWQINGYSTRRQGTSAWVIPKNEDYYVIMTTSIVPHTNTFLLNFGNKTTAGFWGGGGRGTGRHLHSRPAHSTVCIAVYCTRLRSLIHTHGNFFMSTFCPSSSLFPHHIPLTSWISLTPTSKTGLYWAPWMFLSPPIYVIFWAI